MMLTDYSEKQFMAAQFQEQRKCLKNNYFPFWFFITCHKHTNIVLNMFGKAAAMNVCVTERWIHILRHMWINL